MPIPGLGQALPPVIGAVAVEAASAVSGGPSPEHVDFAAALLRSLPEKVREAAHDTFDSCALIYALMLDKRDGAVRGIIGGIIRGLSLGPCAPAPPP